MKDKKPSSKPKAKEDELSEQISELTHTLQRVQAEFENYRKRVDNQAQEHKKMAIKELLLELLPVLDNFGLAFQHKENTSEFVKGIEMMYAQLYDVLQKHHLEPFDPLGELFNPEEHEALMLEESDKPNNTVIEVFQKGYKLNGCIIRLAKVKVGKNSKENTSKNEPLKNDA
jgi:molecular chaperone GrpE